MNSLRILLQKSKPMNSKETLLLASTLKKELLGNLYCDGQLYTKETIEVYDHDFPYLMRVLPPIEDAKVI